MKMILILMISFKKKMKKSTYLLKIWSYKTYNFDIEVKIFRIICQIKNMYFIRTIIVSKCLKFKKDKTIKIVFN